MSFAPFVLRWRLAPDLSLAPAGETDVTLTFPGGGTITLTPGSVGLRDALLALVDGADEDRLLSLAGGEAAAAAARLEIQRHRLQDLADELRRCARRRLSATPPHGHLLLLRCCVTFASRGGRS